MLTRRARDNFTNFRSGSQLAIILAYLATVFTIQGGHYLLAPFVAQLCTSLPMLVVGALERKKPGSVFGATQWPKTFMYGEVLAVPFGLFVLTVGWRALKPGHFYHSAWWALAALGIGMVALHFYRRRETKYLYDTQQQDLQFTPTAMWAENTLALTVALAVYTAVPLVVATFTQDVLLWLLVFGGGVFIAAWLFLWYEHGRNFRLTPFDWDTFRPKNVNPPPTILPAAADEAPAP